MAKKKRSAKLWVLKIKDGWVSAAVASFITAECVSRSVAPFHWAAISPLYILFFLKGTVKGNQTSGLSVGTAQQSVNANAPQRNRWGSTPPLLACGFNQGPIFSPSRFKPGSSFVIRTVIDHIKSHFKSHLNGCVLVWRDPSLLLLQQPVR